MSDFTDIQMVSGNLASTNCATLLGCYPQPLTYTPPTYRTISIEAVDDGGYIISCYFNKCQKRCVAAGSKAAAEILRDWAAQFEAKTK